MSRALLDRLWERAADFAAVPYGIEALEIMRTEKGYIHIGTDTDGTTLPQDIGFARAIERKAANFVGRRSLLRPAARDPGRFQLVALSPVDGRTAAARGRANRGRLAADANRGPCDLELLESGTGRSGGARHAGAGLQRLGDRVRVHHLGSVIDAKVVKAPFIDPEGERLRG